MTNNVYQRKDGRFEARMSLGKDENGNLRITFSILRRSIGCDLH